MWRKNCQKHRNIIKVAYLLPVNVFTNLYHTLIHYGIPYLTYGNVCLASTYQRNFGYVDQVAEEGGPCHN